jgi:hypothetical protein
MIGKACSTRFAVGLCACVFAPAAFAYVGPGAGLGVLGAMLAIFAAVLATIVGLVLWPVRMLMRRRRRNAAAHDAQAPEASSSHSSPSAAPHR